ncbi:MAG TPA: hypothetical protein VEA38_08490 [Terriglobales bacterium]|nr:hypothetical protein [Terriglobales bacterium]
MSAHGETPLNNHDHERVVLDAARELRRLRAELSAPGDPTRNPARYSELSRQYVVAERALFAAVDAWQGVRG